VGDFSGARGYGVVVDRNVHAPLGCDSLRHAPCLLISELCPLSPALCPLSFEQREDGQGKGEQPAGQHNVQRPVDDSTKAPGGEGQCQRSDQRERFFMPWDERFCFQGRIDWW